MQGTPRKAFGGQCASRSAMQWRGGLSTNAAIEKLVIQICYRAADLAYLLSQRGERLSRYSRYLRREPDEGYLDENEA